MRIWLNRTAQVSGREQVTMQVVPGIVLSDLAPGERLVLQKHATVLRLHRFPPARRQSAELTNRVSVTTVAVFCY